LSRIQCKAAEEPQPLNDLAEEIYDNAVAHGFYEEDFHPGVKLMLVVTELAEVLEDVRIGNKEHEGEEVADAVIRLLDYAKSREIDLDYEVKRKIEINQARPYKHGKSFDETLISLLTSSM
jgi:NTP pyrophosphatase (non-canonical NTP hydrolase)